MVPFRQFGKNNRFQCQNSAHDFKFLQHDDQKWKYNKVVVVHCFYAITIAFQSSSCHFRSLTEFHPRTSTLLHLKIKKTWGTTNKILSFWFLQYTRNHFNSCNGIIWSKRKSQAGEYSFLFMYTQCWKKVKHMFEKCYADCNWIWSLIPGLAQVVAALSHLHSSPTLALLAYPFIKS